MSLYCQHKDCPKKEQCIRYKYGKKYQGQEIDGLWWVFGKGCVEANFEDFVG